MNSLNKKILIIIVCFINSFMLIFFQNQLYSIELFNKDTIDNIITFLSIIIGFQTSSFAILFNSKIISDLYNEFDEVDKTMTKKHIVKNTFQMSFFYLLSSVIYLVVFSKHFFIFVNNIIIINILIVNCFLLYKCNDYLYKIFMKEKS